MDRAEFVEGYMSRSGLLPYTLEGEIVSYPMDNGECWVLHALECHCDEDGCEGWAMSPHGSAWAGGARRNRHWHKFQNGLTDLDGFAAMEADHQVKLAEYRARHGKDPDWL